MNCRILMDKVYDALRERTLPLWFRLKLGIHLLFCRRCAEEVKRLEMIQELMETDFFPESPEFEDCIMNHIYTEEIDLEDFDSELVSGVSFRSWVVTGFIVLISLSTAFFGMDFIRVAASQGSSFLIPVGLTIGCMVTGYGAMFISSHLKKLSEWLRLDE
ncbi:MAG: peptidoglycan-binding protein [Treponema sp.]|jgi:hypothetical protein|nr:peptidoglycan-binding protein [Treponema sp.]